jgi:hypothetical protein
MLSSKQIFETKKIKNCVQSFIEEEEKEVNL